MRKFILIICLISLTIASKVSAQTKLSKEFKKSSIQKLEKLINENYIFEDVAKKTSEHLEKQLQKGFFDQFNNIDSFARALTNEVQFINKDRHMQIRAMTSNTTKTIASPEKFSADAIEYINGMREENAGFKDAKKLDGNIGYFEIQGFAPLNEGVPIADAYMKLLNSSDAIIIDLRNNGGGEPAMVQYLCSYFFNKHLLLNTLYYRVGNKTEEYWTLDKVNGEKLPEVPLFILSSDRSFSGAEEFCYDMQTQKRATLVGETTGGGANPGDVMTINEELKMFMPTGKAINPITGTNWEGVGVVPEVKTNAEEAYDKAVILASDAAKEYRQKKAALYKNLLQELYTSLNPLDLKTSKNENLESHIFQNLKKCYETNIFNEFDINILGYDYIQNEKNDIAEIIFKCNTLLFPNSANTFDSYGDVLALNGKLDLSLISYQKAVDLATQQQSPQLELFTKNLQKTKQKIK